MKFAFTVLFTFATGWFIRPTRTAVFVHAIIDAASPEVAGATLLDKEQ